MQNNVTQEYQFNGRRVDTVFSDEPLITVPVDGGVLVYRPLPKCYGRELVGFANVTDWEAFENAVRTRGHGSGALLHLPVFDVSVSEGSV